MPQAVLTEEMARELAQYEREWVALSRDNTKIIGHDKSLAELDKRVNPDEVVYMKIPPSGSYLSFQF